MHVYNEPRIAHAWGARPMQMPQTFNNREPLPAGIQHVSDVMAALLRLRVSPAAESTPRRPHADVLPALELSLASEAAASAIMM